MKWRVADAGAISSRQIDRAPVWSLRLREPALPDVALGLCLLMQDLVTAVTFVDDSSGRLLGIQRGKEPGTYRAAVTWHADGASLVLSPIELEMLAIFCLKTVRDGAAEVDHVDIQATHPTAGNASFVFNFPAAQGPVSAEEARRRLRL